MARPSKMWFRKDRSAWFVTINGRRHNLGDNKETAKKQFHLLMAEVEQPNDSEPFKQSITVAEIMDKYLVWCRDNRAATTFSWYSDFLQGFLDSLQNQNLTVDRLKPLHVNEWIASHGPAWNNSTIRGAMRAVQRAFNWAEKQGYIEKSPIKYLEKPSAVRREEYPSPAEFRQMLNYATEPFRSYLSFLYETGCRPQEARMLEHRHVHNDKVVFEVVESKGKKTRRVIYLNQQAKRLISGRSGYAFTNSLGNPWTAYAINCRMRRIGVKTGKHYCAYSVRHLTATRWLEAGLDHITVAKLLGHKDASMLAKIYQHIGEKNDYLLSQLRKVS